MRWGGALETLTLGACVACAHSAPPTAANNPPPPPQVQWSQVWSDEFDGAAARASTKQSGATTLATGAPPPFAVGATTRRRTTPTQSRTSRSMGSDNWRSWRDRLRTD